MLNSIIPFRYLSASDRRALEADLTAHEFAVGDVVIRQDDTDDQRVFLLASGAVEILDTTSDPPASYGLITAGHYFGERSVLFDEPRALEVRAAEPTRASSMSGDRFLRLIRESRPFAQALGKILRDKQGIFRAFDRFYAELFNAVSDGAIHLEQLLPIYQELQPALHPRAVDPHEIDIAALTYAVRRLPVNVTRTLTFYLTEMLPLLYRDPDTSFQPVATDARRRAVYEMLPGKNMVLLRDGYSDIVDLVSCLCLYTIEARKIRRRARDRGGRDRLTDDDVATVKTIWGDETPERIRDIVLHHEDFRIEIHKEVDSYNSAHAETWAQEIAEATHELLGCDPTELPVDVPVHLVSSNTHSVYNSLSPWLETNAAAIRAWGRRINHPLADDGWLNEQDLAYALTRDFFVAHPEAVQDRDRVDREAGIHVMSETAFTGIAVQIIDTSTLLRGRAIDPRLDVSPDSSAGIIVNIDYAFGEQAEHIVANLINLFGRNLTSVNVLGKAGALTGSRGDVLVATGFVHQSEDRYYPIPGHHAVDVDRLRAALPGRAVHEGTMLTVAGTLLQNRVMLHFNRHIWGCVGLEMEGAFYLREVLESVNCGTVSNALQLRFLYYVSDLPLAHDANLSARMQAIEGVPPLYAVTREILSGILGSDRAIPDG